MPELVADRIVRLLQREGAEAIVGFPENRLFNSAALVGMRPIITRTERVAVNIATPASNTATPPATALAGRLAATAIHPTRPMTASGRGQRRSWGDSVSAAALATA